MSELSRLRWLCRRGMKELDLVMSRYLEEHYAAASADEQRQFRMLLELPDPDLYGLLLGRQQSDDAKLQGLTQKLRGMSTRS